MTHNQYLISNKSGYSYLIFICLLLFSACGENQDENQIQNDLKETKIHLLNQRKMVSSLEEKRLSQMKLFAEKELLEKKTQENCSIKAALITQYRSDIDVAQDALSDAKSWKILRNQPQRESDIAKASNRLHKLEQALSSTENEYSKLKNELQEIAAAQFIITSALNKIETDLDNARNQLPNLEKRAAELEESLKK